MARAGPTTSQWLWLGGATPEAVREVAARMQARKTALAFFAPRGVEPAGWQAQNGKANQIRRRYMLLGQTLDSMRVWDIRCAAQAVKALPEFKKPLLCLSAKPADGRQRGLRGAVRAGDSEAKAGSGCPPPIWKDRTILAC